MDRETFKSFRERVIDRYVAELETLDNVGALTCHKNRIDYIYKHYERKRLEIRRFFMNIETKPMDRHKIGACIMYATLKSNVFSVNRLIDKLPGKLLMANEYLATYLALSVVESYKMDELNNQYWLIKIPSTYHGDAYIENLCKALYCIPSINCFDIFAYSNILFLLEKYTDDCCINN